MYRMIIVDDEEIIRNGLTDLIDWKSIGFEIVATFEDGSDAIVYLQSECVDVVFTDIQMYQISGIELSKYITTHYPKIKIVALSNYREFDYIKQMLSLDACDYILKPINPDEVISTFTKIKTMLENENLINSLVQQPELTTPENVIYKKENLINDIKDYIQTHFQSKLSIEEIAQHVFYNPSYLSRDFKLQTGTNLTKYILDCRMHAAFDLLTENKLSVNEIAQKVGYDDVRYFHRTFKKYTGYSIREYQRILKQKSN